MKYELIALDMDGTILSSDMEISKGTIKAIKECYEKGIKVVLASGRYYDSIKAFANCLNIIGEQITLNGSVIKDAATGKTLHEFPIPQNDYDLEVKKLEKCSWTMLVFTADKYYKTQDNEETREIERLTGPCAEMISSFRQIINPIKILLIINNEEEIDRAKELLEDDKYSLIRTGYNNVELVRRDVSKGKSLEIIAEKYNIERKNILAIGDSENDIEMIKYAGMGIAMGNAYEHVKEISDEITSSNDEEGVSKAIYKHILNV